MYCPRCGAPNEQGDRFCSACGAELREDSAEKEPINPRERLGRIVGTTRKARIVTAATVVAFVVAIAAFFALKSNEDSIPRDAYTLAAERLCFDAKAEIVTTERRASKGETDQFARELVPIVATWRSGMSELKVPPDRTEQAALLEAALLEAEVKIGKLARVSSDGDRAAVVASARQADAASTDVEEAVSGLGLTQCARATIGLARQGG